MRVNHFGSVPTDKLFTGQRLDGTGLYFYNARYYDPTIGRFISADSIVPNPINPQAFNRYSYCLNNPLRYIDPTGHQYDDWYYESLCEEAGIDPDAGYALFLGDDGGVAGKVKISTFVGWVDDTPERFDYISQSPHQRSLEAATQGMGVVSIKNYHRNLTADPIVLVESGRNSIRSQVSTGHNWQSSREFEFITGVLLIAGGTTLAVVTVIAAAHLGPFGVAFIPVLYAEVGFITEGINRVYGRKVIPDLLPIFGP